MIIGLAVGVFGWLFDAIVVSALESWFGVELGDEESF